VPGRETATLRRLHGAGREHVSRDSDDYTGDDYIGVGKGACLSSALLVATQRVVDYQAHQ